MSRQYLRPPWAARVIGARGARLFKQTFRALPDPADHPAFLITVTDRVPVRNDNPPTTETP